MSMREAFADAIAGVGARAVRYREGEAAVYFDVSLQPRGLAENGAAPAGLGNAARFNLYAVGSDNASLLRAGDAVELSGRRFRVLEAQPQYLGGQAVFCKALLIEEAE